MSEKMAKRVNRSAQRLLKEKEPELIKQAVGRLATFRFWKRVKFALLILWGERLRKRWVIIRKQQSAVSQQQSAPPSPPKPTTDGNVLIKKI